MSISIKWKVEDNTALAARIAEESARDVVLENAEKVVFIAKALAPVDSGKLKGSIDFVETSKEPSNPEVEVGAKADHALFVEKGTEKTKRQPFLTPALQRVKQDMPRDMLNEMRREFD